MPEQRTYQGHVYERAGPGQEWSLTGAAASPAPSSGPTPIFTAPADPAKVAAEARAATDQGLQMDAAARSAEKDRRDQLEWTATHNPDGSKKVGPEEGKPVPAWAEKPYSQQIGVYGGISRGLNTFKDDYAGNTVTGGLENTLQGAWSSIGSEGQRDWWSQFGSTDNVIRNDLFGAALTDSEKAAYAATTVDPSMDPKEVRRNLQSRRDILTAALKRRTNFMKAQGYSKEAIEALAGEYAQELGAATVAPAEPPAPSDADNKPAVEVSQNGDGEIQTPEDKEFKRQADELFARGGARADFDALAAKYGRGFEGDFGAKLDAAIKARNSGTSVPGFEITPSGKKEASAIGAMAASPVGSYFGGAADVVTSGFLDEIAPAFGGDTGQTRLAMDAMREEHPIASGIGSLTGGALIPLGRGATTVRELAGIGGTLGAAYGVGSGDTAGERVSGGVVGGLTGAALGAGLGKLSDIWSRRGSGGPGAPKPPSNRGQEAADISAASRDLNVPMMPADVGGAPFAWGSSFARMTPGGAQPITAAARRSQEAAGDALSGIAAREGQVLEREALGETVRRGALDYREGSRNSIGRLYTEAADQAGDARVSPEAAIGKLDQHIAELGEIPGGADGLSVLQALRNDIAERGSISVNGIRGMRTQLRQKFAKDNLRGSDIERRVNEVVDAASNDLVSSLRAQGKADAARTYAEADRQWAERIKTLDDTIMPIIGKRGEKSGEQIADALNAAAKGNNARLSRLFDALPAEEAGNTRASMIEAMGRATAGNQNATGDAFSFGTFLTNWSKVGNSAKNAIFTGDGRKAIDQLALLAEKAKNAKSWQNYSNTGIGILGTVTGASGMAGAATFGKTIVAEYALGRLLASPRVAKAILNIAQAKTPQAISARIGNLSGIAAKEGALAPEITGLQQRLMQAMNDNVASVAAGGEQEQKPQR